MGRRRIGWDRPLDPWELPYGRTSTDEEQAEFLILRNKRVCQLCGRTDQDLAYEHDHAVGIHAVRLAACPGCNSHMTGIDAGRYAIDLNTRRKLVEPFYLSRVGQRLHYDPLVSVSIDELSAADRYEVNRLSWEYAGDIYSMRKAQPVFEHYRVAAVLAHGDMRPALRLRYLNIRGFRDLNIAAPDDRISTFQRLYMNLGWSMSVESKGVKMLQHDLPRLDAEAEDRPADPWAHIAAEAA